MTEQLAPPTTVTAVVVRSSLSVPTRTRWQPLRLGLINLYRYDEQVFHFEDGRLLLRGNNGTGKSRVVALTLPFLLDGEISPHRVEPDGDPAKRIEWNLLLGIHDDRLGYSWLEFGRLDDDGSERFVTIGCGMRAVSGRGAPTRWLFVTDRRVGKDLSLVADTGQALTRERLRLELGDRGELHETATAYRRTVDQTLFGLGEARYHALVDLLIQLRRPQLSRQLDEALLSEALSEALPPIDPAMIADVAEAFRALDDDRDRVEGFRAAYGATDRFLHSYRNYAAVAMRRRVREVTSANSRYEDAQRQLKATTEGRDEQAQRVAELTRRLDQLDGQVADADTEVRTLETSPAMDRARELDTARSRESELTTLAAERKADRDRASEGVRRREEEHTGAELAAAASNDRTGAALDAAANAADAIDCRKDHLAALAPVEAGGADDPLSIDVARRHLGQLVDRADEHVQHLLALDTAVNQAAAELTDARRVLDRHNAALDHAHDVLAAAERQVGTARDQLVHAYRAWVETAVELAPAAPDDVAEPLVDWSGEGTGPVTRAVTVAAEFAVGLLADEEAVVTRDRGDARAHRGELQRERDAVAAGYHEPPVPHPGRDSAGRAGRAGGALWQLVDWRDEITARDRAGYEAALQAAGILDAWVTPDGRLLDVDDALLAVDISAPGYAVGLRDVLVPDRSLGAEGATPPVGPDVVEAVLRAIGAAPDAGPTWVDADGCYQIGPVAGRFRKPDSQHIGHPAREAARRARLADLDGRVAEADRFLDNLDARTAALVSRRERLAHERQAAPTEDELRQAWTEVDAARRRVATCRQDVEQAEQAVAVRHRALDDSIGERDRAAVDLGLTAWVGRLEHLARGIADYRVALAGLWPRLDAHREVVAGLQRAARERVDACDLLERAGAAAAETERHARDARTRRQTLEATSGAEVEEVLARLEQARARHVALKGEQEYAAADRTAARVAEQVAAQRMADLETQLDDAAGVRAGVVERLRHAVVAGLPAVASGDLGDVTAPDDRPWAPDPAVRSARRIDQQLADVDTGDDHWRRVQGDIHGHFTELERALLPHSVQPTASLDDDLFVVAAPFQGRTHTIPALRDLLADELETRQALLDAREREVLENHLVGEVATQLHELIRGGETLVAEMNAEVEQRPTSTGMRLRFVWRPRDDGPQSFGDARRRLLAADHVWSPEDREALGVFLQARIREVRDADDTGTWQEHLARALDYRRWHLFLVERQQDSAWVRLTRRTHGTGSGGEKALALTIPQFAAAAAHYRSADVHAPRLIVLDEVFVGIDSDMRAKCMDLLARFDLDVVMTSEREWACYPTVPGVAIYQLSTRPGIDAVGVHRWVWNGHQRLAVQEPDNGQHVEIDT